MVTIKRAYEPVSPDDGTRILVDRLWPRGVAKNGAKVAEWMRELGPSNELRKFFGHEPARWEEFRRRYKAELKQPEARAMLEKIARMAERGRVTLVYGAKDERHNQAVVLKEIIDSL